MRILIAPDKFKGTLTAPAAALAIAEGARSARPNAVITSCPVADGGGGTLTALLDALGGTTSYVTSVDPWMQRARMPIGLLGDGRAVVETASDRTGDPLTADTFGIGRAIVEAGRLTEGGPVLVAVGGTASTDGGTGLARALGWKFLDPQGESVGPGGGSLHRIARIVPPADAQTPQVVALCDVDAPLIGASGSARGFAAQKGATPAQVDLLEEGLAHLSEVVAEQLGTPIGSLARGGAGGGIGAGLHAFAGAELTSGFEAVADAVNLRQLAGAADVVITGEGSFDEQSLMGKAPVGVARLSHELGVPCLGLFGRVEVPVARALGIGFSDVLDLVGTFGTRRDPSEPTATVISGAAALVARQPV